MKDLRAFLDVLRRENDLATVEAEADPRLEIPEIHRRVIEQGGPAERFRLMIGENGSEPVCLGALAPGERLLAGGRAHGDGLVNDLDGVLQTAFVGLEPFLGGPVGPVGVIGGSGGGLPRLATVLTEEVASLAQLPFHSRRGRFYRAFLVGERVVQYAR